MKAVILAGGKGTRLAPYTKVIPKPLMPIGDMPILEVLLWQMKEAGVTDVVLTVGHMAELLRAFFKDGESYGLTITYSYEDTPLGTAGPLSMVEGLDDTFIVTNGDVLTTLPLRDLIAFHKQRQAVATISMHLRKVNIDLGIIPDTKTLREQKLMILADLARVGFCNVDLIFIDSGDIVLRYEAVRQNNVVYQSPSFDRGSTYSKIIRQYLYFYPYLAVQRRAYKKRIINGKS